MEVQKLTWAGSRITSGQTRLYLDPLFEHPPRFAPFIRNPVDYAAPGGAASAVLLTHLHEDHYVPSSVRRVAAADTPILCPASVAAQLEQDGFRAIGVEPWESHAFGAVTVTALPAVDGLGDPQVSWAVRDSDRCVVHCGDTLWHGYWWKIATTLGVVDLALVPINGAQVNYPWLQPPSGVEAVMTPEQAAAGAHALKAQTAIPIHYSTYNFPPAYVERANAEQTFLEETAKRGVNGRVLEPGAVIDL